MIIYIACFHLLSRIFISEYFPLIYIWRVFNNIKKSKCYQYKYDTFVQDIKRLFGKTFTKTFCGTQKLWEVVTNGFLRGESRFAIAALSIVWIDCHKILAKQPKMVSWKFIIHMHIQERNLITYIHNLQARIVT